MIIPLYCNPFFPRCKQNFRKMQKFFSGQGQKSPQISQLFPKQPKNRPQSLSSGTFPDHTACRQSGKIPHPKIPTADPKGEKKPDPDCPQQESPIGQRRMPGPGRTQEAVK
ncbi:hypothetical protein MR626_05340 [bacterium]|nr:hypothetical protein [bacterium]